ncbi:hypothetical protein SAMN02745157_4718 [Kaistia soli DSM 19436]|uniref:Uncharacterized protein n=1 Tax=Kaistia soli DSM 19436 TaxID=1122133 RepID=A0A1M5M8H7_9HYPH|nr:hypothetical protein [Kaistia soli]SHG73550.1 hypothetical protein SAMN02745157_4718 [Kaistia soli DSM 19436]
MSGGPTDAQPRPSGGRELFQITVGVALFVLVAPLVLGAVLFLGVIVTTFAGDAIDAMTLGRTFDPTTSMIVATGLMLVMLRVGWLMIYGALLLPSAAAGAAIAVRRILFGAASWRFAAATGIIVGLIADVAVVGYGHSFLGATRIALFAGWVVIGSLVATLICWRIAALAPAAAGWTR